MEPKRVLIVEPDSAFALSLASLYRDEGFATGIAATAAEAQLEIATRRPDLCIVRAELPDLSGFSLCAQMRHDPASAGLPLVLYSSDTPPESLADHARTPWAANGYLSMPLDTDALLALSDEILAASPVEFADEAAVEDVDVTGATREEPATGWPAPAGPEAGTPQLPAPPPVPRRPTRSTVTDEDRIFTDRVFQSIAAHRDELVRESLRHRPPPRRDLLATPEGRVQLLREDLKAREAQIARLSEIWEAREREFASADQRIHDRDVEIQGLKNQIDDLLRRLAEARDLFLAKEKEFGASLDGLLQEKFVQERDLTAVVASHEHRVHELEAEVRRRDDDLAHRKLALSESQE
ncbi:MAG TPA: response regulator, partial [Anaeromyxobacteraceae bacterium]|nr:response regulator [Anaeromyxobacteraceae bacterium]